MRIRICLLSAAFFLFCLPAAAQAQEYGKIRALKERAAFVTKQKNDFIDRVLTSYKIPHELNPQGIVVRVKIEERWLVIKQIEIIPLLKESADKSQSVAGHELYFYTANNILNLESELTIK
jgi:hypothetical protein